MTTTSSLLSPPVAESRWTVLPVAEASLAQILRVPATEAAEAARIFAGYLRPTLRPARQKDCEIWRASHRWHRLRAVVQRLSATELALVEVLAHDGWSAPTWRPVPPAPPAPSAVVVERRAAPRPAPRPAPEVIIAAPLRAPLRAPRRKSSSPRRPGRAPYHRCSRPSPQPSS
jgi:hypothetical protein